jgi:CDP-diacylglycerol--glycerol-3-phosphate 3-phosphatidyltransferase
MDGLDGLVARNTGKKSPWGALLDSTADRITEIAWLSGVLFFYCNAPGGRLGIFLTFAAMSGALMVSYVRARSEGARIPCASGLLQRPERILILMACFLAGSAIMTWGLALLSVLAYATVVQRLIVTYKYCKKNPS